MGLITLSCRCLGHRGGDDAKGDGKKKLKKTIRKTAAKLNLTPDMYGWQSARTALCALTRAALGD